MPFKHLFLLFCSACACSITFSQHIDEGTFTDWDYGPSGVYGNLPVNRLTDRNYIKIEKSGTDSVKVTHVNPSGVVTNTSLVIFRRGILAVMQQTDQWGDDYETRTYDQTGRDTFKVTDHIRGVNIFLPCKYTLNIYTSELLTEIRYFSFTGELAENRNGIAIIRYRRYDDKVRFAEMKEVSFFDAADRPVISKGSEYHKVVNVYDEQANKISETYYGINDEPITLRKGAQAGARFSYDQDNNRIKNEFIGLDGAITYNLNQIASIEFEYTKGYETQSTAFDIDHQKSKSSAAANGLAIARNVYDNQGNHLKESYFDENDRPMIDHSGVHAIVSTFSSSNMLTRISFFNASGEPAANRDKTHSIVYVKDKKGRIVSLANFDVNGKPIKSFTEEVFMLKYSYDQYGRRDTVSYWLDDFHKMTSWNNNFEQVTRYDDDGQPVEYISLDYKGRLNRNLDGSSSNKLIYNADGRLAERIFLFDGKPVNRQRGFTKGYSRIKYSYNKNGLTDELLFLDSSNSPAAATIYISPVISASRVVFKYTGTRIVEQWFYAADKDEPFLKLDCLANDFVNASGISMGRRNIE